MTVAIAAPRTPRAGMGPRPKISTGSKMMLTTAPRAWEIMEGVALPVAIRSFSMPCAWNMPKEKIVTMETYWAP